MDIDPVFLLIDSHKFQPSSTKLRHVKKHERIFPEASVTWNQKKKTIYDILDHFLLNTGYRSFFEIEAHKDVPIS